MADKESMEEKIFNKKESFPSIDEKIDLNVEKSPLKPEKREGLDDVVQKSAEDKARSSVPVKDEPAGMEADLNRAAIIKKREEAIDAILADGLSDVFLKMNPAKQQEFKKEGEETVKKISQLLSETKVKVAKIIDLVKKWLRVIPGVNKFFVEQEAKLKTDRIIKMKKDF